MENKEHQMVPIWYFIGILLTIYGVVITGYGLFSWSVPSGKDTDVMRNVHMDVWWGAFMFLLGLFYWLRFRPSKAAEREAALAAKQPVPVETNLD